MWELTQILNRCVDIANGASIPCRGTRWTGWLRQRGAIGTSRLDGLTLVASYGWQAGHKGCVVLKTGWGPSVEYYNILGTYIWTIGRHKWQKWSEDRKRYRIGQRGGFFFNNKRDTVKRTVSVCECACVYVCACVSVCWTCCVWINY